MTPDQLNEFVALCQHPAIAGRRGEWQWYDAYYDPEDERPIDEITPGQVRMFRAGGDGIDHLIWLPSVYSYTDPSRCLWAWVDWENWGIQVNKSGTAIISSPDGIYIDPLPIALAKAVIWQYEQEHSHDERQRT